MIKQSLEHFLTDAFAGQRPITSSDLRDFALSVMGSDSVEKVDASIRLNYSHNLIVVDFDNNMRYLELPNSGINADVFVGQSVDFVGKIFRILNTCDFDIRITKDLTLIDSSIWSEDGFGTEVTLPSGGYCEIVSDGSNWIVRHTTKLLGTSSLQDIQNIIQDISDLQTALGVEVTSRTDADVLANSRIDSTNSRVSALEPKVTNLEAQSTSHSASITTLTSSKLDASVVSNLNQNKIVKWNNATGRFELDSNTYLQTETEPQFNASASKNITSTEITLWNSFSTLKANVSYVDSLFNSINLTSYFTKIESDLRFQPIGSYLTTETDPLFTSWKTNTFDPLGITALKISHWETAFSWGNHVGLYASTSHTHSNATQSVSGFMSFGDKIRLDNLSKTDVGLGNVDNTSDSSKPISIATANALANKLDTSVAISTYQPIDSDLTSISALTTPTSFGLLKRNSDNTWTLDQSPYLTSVSFAMLSGKPTTLSGYGITDAYTKTTSDSLYAPISHTHSIANITGLQTALDGKLATSYVPTFASLTGKPTTLSGYGITDSLTLAVANATFASVSHTHTSSQITDFTTAVNSLITSKYGVANGILQLDGSALIPSAYLPSYVDDVLEFANLASFPATGTSGKIYIALDTNFQYRWGGTTYVDMTSASGSVLSVNGQTGIVNLTSTDIGDTSLKRFVTDTQKTNWDSAFTWGNHASVGYLVSSALTPYYTKTQVDNIFNGTTAEIGYNKGDWDTAFGWGNHSLASYVTSSSLTTTLSGYATTSALSAKQDSLNLLTQEEVEKFVTCVAVSTSTTIPNSLAVLDTSVTPIAGDLVLCNSLTTASTRGIYVAGTTTWVKWTGFDQSTEIIKKLIYVSGGNVYCDTWWTSFAKLNTVLTDPKITRIYEFASTSLAGIASFTSTAFAVSATGAVSMAVGTTTNGITPQQFKYVTTAPTTAGMLSYVGTGGTAFTGLAIGVSGTFLKSTGTAPSWSALSASDIPNLDWAKITSGKPTTLSGYGITDAYTQSQVNSSLALKLDITTASSTYEPIIASKVDGFLKWSGSSWSFDTSTYALASSLSSYALTSHNHALSTLTDVTITTPSDLQFLRYDSATSKWKNSSVTLFDGTWTSLSGKPTFASVATSGSYADLSNKPTIVTTIMTQTDVNPLTLANKQSLFYNTTNSKWENRVIASADLPDLSATYLTNTNATSNYQAKDTSLTALLALAGTSGFLKKTSATTWSLDTATYLTANQTITLQGDVTGSGNGTFTTTLATISQGATGSFVKVTLDTKGRVTGNTSVTGADVTALFGSSLASSTFLVSPNGSTGSLAVRAMVNGDLPTKITSKFVQNSQSITPTTTTGDQTTSVSVGDSQMFFLTFASIAGNQTNHTLDFSSMDDGEVYQVRIVQSTSFKVTNILVKIATSATGVVYMGADKSLSTTSGAVDILTISKINGSIHCIIAKGFA